MKTMNQHSMRAATGLFATAGGQLVAGALWLALRAVALALYTLLALGEFFVAPVLSVLAFGAFAVALLFGFILQMPFAQKWEVLGFSVLIMFAYFAYRAVMALLLRLAQGPAR